MHPDKIADRIAGALIDYAYKNTERPKIAVEVLIGHMNCTIIAETSVNIPLSFIEKTVSRISGIEAIKVNYIEVPQNVELARNQSKKIRCGDNGIFKGMPLTEEQKELSSFIRSSYEENPTDGKFILDKKADKIICCQSNVYAEKYKEYVKSKNIANNIVVNPLGDWTGGVNVDTGATNRKLGSDMADAVTGGGLHGKDLSKADVAVNIYAHLKAQETGKPVEIFCAIGDDFIDGKPYGEVVEIAKQYIDNLGGFENLAEWGLY